MSRAIFIYLAAGDDVASEMGATTVALETMVVE